MNKSLLLLSLAMAAPLQAAVSNGLGGDINPALLSPARAVQQPSTAAATTAAWQHSGNTAAVAFGTYLIEPHLQAIAVDPSSPTMATSAVTTLGDRQIAAAPAGAPVSQLTTDTVVRNQLTGELGVMTGRLSIVANNAAVVTQLAQRYQLQSLKSLRLGKVQLLQAPAGTDLAVLLQQLRQHPGVEAVQLDVLENINTPQ